MIQKEYKTIREVKGPLLMVEGVEGAKYQELVDVELPSGQIRRGQVLEASDSMTVVQMLEETRGIQIKDTKAKFLGKTLEIGVSKEMLGRVFSGTGKPIDHPLDVIPEKKLDINGNPLNPYSRAYPDDFIQTGVSTIDGLNTLVRGQKLPIFSASGLPHNDLVVQIARQARVASKKTQKGKEEPFAIVFGAMGITFAESQFFVENFRETGALQRSALFINLANDPVIERINLPRIALTTAEYLAFEKEMHVLVILIDMTNYCEALREVSAARKEIPGRRGYPGYLYTDLSTIYERAGRIKGKEGSITQLPVLTMPEDDKTHPIPDLTGYITEGQIVLSREFQKKGIYPPVDVLSSLSRLKDKGIGEGKTREDHSNVLNQLFSNYSQGKEIRELATILGEGALSDTDKKFLKFAELFEDKFIKQSFNENRTIEETLNIGWELLSMIPRHELKRIKDEFINKYLKIEDKE